MRDELKIKTIVWEKMKSSIDLGARREVGERNCIINYRTESYYKLFNSTHDIESRQNALRCFDYIRE